MGQHDKDQVSEETSMETVAPCYGDTACVVSKHNDHYGYAWNCHCSARIEKIGLRLAVTHNDQGLDKAGSNALSSPCAQRAKAHQEH
jgi:hypothetical protein